MHLKFREQSRQGVTGKETQLLKTPFKIHNARMETKSLLFE